MKKDKKKTIAISLKESTIKKLKEEAELKDCSVSEIVESRLKNGK